MKCNLPKAKRLSREDQARLEEALTTVTCCRCGQAIEVMSLAYAMMNFDKNRYENRLCDNCRKAISGEG